MLLVLASVSQVTKDTGSKKLSRSMKNCVKVLALPSLGKRSVSALYGNKKILGELLDECQTCGRAGHVSRYCPVRGPEILKGKHFRSWARSQLRRKPDAGSLWSSRCWSRRRPTSLSRSWSLRKRRKLFQLRSGKNSGDAKMLGQVCGRIARKQEIQFPLFC